jgi:flavin-dependent dehydrogenase
MKPITIIGGGLAGLTLGIFLRREGIPVTVFEAGDYPRHRVCGEFISGDGRDIFLELGLKHHAVEAKRAEFHVGARPAFPIQVEGSCLPRYELDFLLAREFQKEGGELRVHERFESEAAGVVHASGRRRAETSGGHLFGLKAHVSDAQLGADLEIHFSKNRYVGICRVAENRFNVCGLFYSPKAVGNVHSAWKEMLSSGVPALEKAQWDEQSFCAVAGITLDRDVMPNSFAIGDAAAMIPPLAGNGMSMAFESAKAAVEPLRSFSKGEISWEVAVRIHSENWRRQFTPRLRWAGVAQRLAFNSVAQNVFASAAQLAPGLAQFFAARTR